MFDSAENFDNIFWQNQTALTRFISLREGIEIKLNKTEKETSHIEKQKNIKMILKSGNLNFIVDGIKDRILHLEDQLKSSKILLIIF